MKNIELASIDQIDLIMKIINACTRHMIDNGIFQWNEKYPTKQSFIDDINNNDLYVNHLENIVSPFDKVYTGNELVKELFENAGYSVVVPDLINREAWQGVSIRQAMKDGGDWEMDVPASVAKIISDIEMS